MNRADLAFSLRQPDRLFIGGRWVSPATRSVFTIVHPADGRAVARIAEAREADMDAAIAAARAAFDKGPWPCLPLEERLAVLSRWAEAIAAREEEIAVAHTAQIGIPISFSRRVAGGAAASLRAHVDFARDYPFLEERPVPGGVARVSREPVGVVAAIVPWNYPSMLGMFKMAPALAAGCPIVVKPSPEAPLDLLIIAECAQEAGFPEGVLSILPADREVGELLVRDQRIDKVSFTGSTAAGKRIAGICAERVARVTLELGGKSAAIVLDDMPAEAAVPALVGQSTLFNGQACMGLTRVLVPRARQDEFAEKLGLAYAALKVGDPFDETVQIGPVASPAQSERVARFLEAGKAEGARVVTGGGVDGCFVTPTLFADVANDMTIAQEEIFGPVLVLMPYDTLEEAIAIANDSPYGLNGAVFTPDAEKALGIAHSIRSGSVAHNGIGPLAGLPFGGFKQSGIGREGSPEALDSYVEIKTTYLQANPAAAA
jgi:acyl-CoA reductase-like NAD-dependent aldehyde dehydrogenase